MQMRMLRLGKEVILRIRIVLVITPVVDRSPRQSVRLSHARYGTTLNNACFFYQLTPVIVVDVSPGEHLSDPTGGDN